MIDPANLPPEKIITAKIKAREAALIVLLRKYQFGNFVVTKQKGYIVLIEAQEKIQVREEDGLELAKDVVQQ